MRSSIRVAAAGLVAGLVLGSVGCAGGSGAMADYPAYATVDDLAAAADVVVQGVVLDERTEDIDIVISSDSDDPEVNPQAGMPGAEEPESDVRRFIVYRVEVGEVFAGAIAPGDVVELKVQAEGSAEPEPRLDVGSAYLLFLSEAYPGGIPRSMLNPDQAAYRFEDGIYTSLRPESTIALEITRADLDALTG